MPCKDIKFCDKIKLFWIYERFETYEEIWKRRNFHSTTTEDGAENGLDVKVLQKIMGHKSITITMQIYNHVSEQRIQDSIKGVASVLAV